MRISLCYLERELCAGVLDRVRICYLDGFIYLEYFFLLEVVFFILRSLFFTVVIFLGSRFYFRYIFRLWL